MQFQGQVQNGVIVLDGGASLPEGSVVVVSCLAPVSGVTARRPSAVVFPLVRSKSPGSVNLTAERVAELLDEDIERELIEGLEEFVVDLKSGKEIEKKYTRRRVNTGEPGSKSP